MDRTDRSVRFVFFAMTRQTGATPHDVGATVSDPMLVWVRGARRELSQFLYHAIAVTWGTALS
jgi:hypothetical protein